MSNKVDNRDLPHWLLILMAVVLISVLVFPQIGLIGDSSAIAFVVLFLIGLLLDVLVGKLKAKYMVSKGKKAV